MSSSTSLTAGAAGRYATALFELAEEAGALDQTEADLAAVKVALAQSGDLLDLTQNPLYTREEQGAAMAAIAQSMGLSDLVKNVIGLMAAKRRLFALNQMIRIFEELMADHRGEITADVTVAHALSDAQATALTDRIKGATGRNTKLNVTVDEGLIGGLIVKVGSKMIDTSIRSKLNSLQNAMKEVG